MHYGQVLADLNKVAQATCQARLVILVADDRYLSYLQRSGQGLLPFNIGAATIISALVRSRSRRAPRPRSSPCTVPGIVVAACGGWDRPGDAAVAV
jgi:hypothetical protein